jgi:hypothetical protein
MFAPVLRLRRFWFPQGNARPQGMRRGHDSTLSCTPFIACVCSFPQSNGVRESARGAPDGVCSNSVGNCGESCGEQR